MEESFVYPNLVNLYTGLGEYYGKAEDNALALEYFIKSEEIAKRYGHNFMSYNYMKWGEFEESLSNYEAALSLYQKALNNLEEASYKHLYPKLYIRMSDVYLAQGDTEKANEYKAKAFEIHDIKHRESLRTTIQVIELLLDEKTDTLKQKYNKEFSIALVLFGFFIISICYFAYKQIKAVQQILNEERIQINNLEKKLNNSFDEIVAMAKKNHPEFYTRFQEAYPNFNNSLLAINNKLTISERRIAAYIYLNFTSKEIAKYSYRSLKTIETTRYNLRKKLKLQSKTNLQAWLMELDR